MEEEEEGHLLLAEGSFFTLCQVQHHHHYPQHEHFYNSIMIVQYQKCVAIAFSGAPPILKMFELTICVVIALAIKSHHGVSPSSTPEEHCVVIDNNPA